MKEIDKDNPPDASGGITNGCIPMPWTDPIFPGGNPYTDPLGDQPHSAPWILPSAADSSGQ